MRRKLVQLKEAGREHEELYQKLAQSLAEGQHKFDESRRLKADKEEEEKRRKKQEARAQRKAEKQAEKKPSDAKQHDESDEQEKGGGSAPEEEEVEEDESDMFGSFFESVEPSAEPLLPAAPKVEKKKVRAPSQPRRRFFETETEKPKREIKAVAGKPLNRRQRRAADRGELKVETEWEDRRDPTLSAPVTFGTAKKITFDDSD